ncbi:hypothetical protein R1flu_026236 [Riccia fluitans]|uniref:CRM domain-containing protein n=1 Tax=Riccia fluitans TaxID=41844 RepID=A0ABD1XJF3_9MARC
MEASQTAGRGVKVPGHAFVYIQSECGRLSRASRNVLQVVTQRRFNLMSLQEMPLNIHQASRRMLGVEISTPVSGCNIVDISLKGRYGVLRYFRFHSLLCSGKARIPRLRYLILKGNFSVTALNPENLPEETSKEDLASFRPPPRVRPITPQELIAEVPFHYWYSYADVPDSSLKRGKKRPKILDDPKGRVTGESTGSLGLQSDRQKDIPVSSGLQVNEARQSLLHKLEGISDPIGPEEAKPRRTLMRQVTKQSSSDKPKEPRVSLMREPKKTPSSSSNTGESRFLVREPKVPPSSSNLNERRSLTREPRVSSVISNSDRNRCVDEVDSLLLWTAEKTREGCSEMVGSEITMRMPWGNRVATLTSAGNIERIVSERSSSGDLDGEHKSLTDDEAEEGTCLEKAAFRLTKKEINLLVDKCNRSNRQINIGWRGWGHNYIMLVHSYWKKSEVCKIKCKGAITLNMDFFCDKLELKTGGRVIHRNLGVVYLYRGREYDPKFAPKLPVMHQRKKTPAKRLPIPFGLTKDDVNAMRARGKELPALCKLAKNGVYVTLLDDIREAFEKSDLVRVNCQGFEARNFRALGVKLKKLVPCVLISYEFEHILMWRWDGYKVPGPEEEASVAEESFKDDEEDAEAWPSFPDS